MTTVITALVVGIVAYFLGRDLSSTNYKKVFLGVFNEEVVYFRPDVDREFRIMNRLPFLNSRRYLIHIRHLNEWFECNKTFLTKKYMDVQLTDKKAVKKHINDVGGPELYNYIKVTDEQK